MTQPYMPPSKTVEWGTPQVLFDRLNSVYNFELDPAASHTNAKCKSYYTKEENGLVQPWHGMRVFLNPPYGRELKHWLHKAWEHYQGGGLVVCLLPARTDTGWFHDYCLKGDIEFIRGRLNFTGGKHSATFPSIIVTFDPKKK